MSRQENWRPGASLENLQLRARILQRIRAFFLEHGVMEVETPILSRFAAVDPYLDSFSTRYTGPGRPQGLPLFLQTSPEFAMKRLLASGSGPIYQICKSFRDGESGRHHNPEFTMLEWYRPGFDHHALMDEMEALLLMVLGDLSVARVRYGELFERHTGLDPHCCEVAELQLAAQRLGLDSPLTKADSRDDWLMYFMSTYVEPRLNKGVVFVYDFPVGQAMLARVSAGEYPVAERFEVYMNGVELANGFHELGDADEQRRRFEQNVAHRRNKGLPDLPMDEGLLAALEQGGLPDCAGVALGIDRLLMLAADADSLDDVVAFTLERS